MRYFFLVILVVALVGCGTAGDFVRSEGSIRSYNRSATWSYDDLLLVRSEGFQKVHEAVALQSAVSDRGDTVFSMVYQTYSHADQRNNEIVFTIDSIPYTFSDPEPTYQNIIGGIVERNIVVLSDTFIEALNVANSIQIVFVNSTNLSDTDIDAIQQFILQSR